MVDLNETLLAAIKKAAGDPQKAIRNANRYSSLDRYHQVQVMKVSGVAGLSGIGGIVTGSALTVGAMANLLRCAANISFAYGASIGAEVDSEDFYAILAIWTGTDINDVICQATAVAKIAKAPFLIQQTAERTAIKITGALAERLAVKAAESIGARILAMVAAGVVPVVGAVAATVLIVRDINNIYAAAQRFYKRKLQGS
ncbi:MAG: hypothetical protein PVI21_01975 [Candidatus Woesebacteria bacterium]|jgi:hypothetical protein